MASHSAQVVGRAASLSVASEGSSRRSLDCLPSGPGRSRSTSIDVRAVRGDPVVATTVLTARAREGVQLEVGRSVDLNEQRRLLEQYWNTEDPATRPEPSLVRLTRSLILPQTCCRKQIIPRNLQRLSIILPLQQALIIAFDIFVHYKHVYSPFDASLCGI